MDLIILNDGLYHLIPVTKELLGDIKVFTEIDCFDLCDIIRLEFTDYLDTVNQHIMKDGTGFFYGCICR